MHRTSPVPGAGPGGRRRVPLVARAWAWLVDGLAALGTLMIVGLMLVIFADVLARNLFGGSLPLVAELGALLLVMIVYLQLGTTVRHDRLARADLFYAGIVERKPRLGGALEAIYCLSGFAVCGLIVWATIDILARDFRIGEYIGVTGVMTLPTWPFRLLILIGIAVAAVQFLVQAALALRGRPAEERRDGR